MTDGPTTTVPVVVARVAETPVTPVAPPPAPLLPDGRPNGLLAVNPGLTAADLAVQDAATRAAGGAR